MKCLLLIIVTKLSINDLTVTKLLFANVVTLNLSLTTYEIYGFGLRYDVSFKMYKKWNVPSRFNEHIHLAGYLLIFYESRHKFAFNCACCILRVCYLNVWANRLFAVPIMPGCFALHELSSSPKCYNARTLTVIKNSQVHAISREKIRSTRMYAKNYAEELHFQNFAMSANFLNSSYSAIYNIWSMKQSRLYVMM